MNTTIINNNIEKNYNNDINNNYKNISVRFCILMAIYAGTLLISNILSNKIIMVFGFVLPCAVILYPMTYILSDSMTEIYGLRLSKIAIKTNTFLNLFMSIIFAIAIQIPYPEFADASAFHATLGNTTRIVAASLLSYYFGDMINSYSLSFFKAKLRNKKIVNTFLFRSICSSIFGQIADTVGFIFLAFYGTIPNEMMFTMMICQYIVKIGYQIILHPITTKIVKHLKKVENIDVIDNW